MTKYNAANPADQPLHDMMDEIEAAYQKCDKAGVAPQKVLSALANMVFIYKQECPDFDMTLEELFQLLDLFRNSMKKPNET